MSPRPKAIGNSIYPVATTRLGEGEDSLHFQSTLPSLTHHLSISLLKRKILRKFLSGGTGNYWIDKWLSGNIPLSHVAKCHPQDRTCWASCLSSLRGKKHCLIYPKSRPIIGWVFAVVVQILLPQSFKAGTSLIRWNGLNLGFRLLCDPFLYIAHPRNSSSALICLVFLCTSAPFEFRKEPSDGMNYVKRHSDPERASTAKLLYWISRAHSDYCWYSFRGFKPNCIRIEGYFATYQVCSARMGWYSYHSSTCVQLSAWLYAHVFVNSFHLRSHTNR